MKLTLFISSFLAVAGVKSLWLNRLLVQAAEEYPDFFHIPAFFQFNSIIYGVLGSGMVVGYTIMVNKREVGDGIAEPLNRHHYQAFIIRVVLGAVFSFLISGAFVAVFEGSQIGGITMAGDGGALVVGALAGILADKFFSAKFLDKVFGKVTKNIE